VIGVTSSCLSICDGDPIGSIHRSWSVGIVLVFIFLVVTVIEVINLHKNSSSGFELAVIWAMIAQLTVSILGTFIMKRFSTSFSIGFLLGVVVVMAQQNLVLGVIFWGFKAGSINHIFANCVIIFFVVYTFFCLILYRFRNSIIVISPTDVLSTTKNRSCLR